MYPERDPFEISKISYSLKEASIGICQIVWVSE